MQLIDSDSSLRTLQDGWAADAPVGLRHAVVRSAYLLAPAPLKGTAICLVVALSYLYSLTFMRKPGADAVDR